MNFLLEEVDDIKILRLKEDRLDSKIAADLKTQLLVLCKDKSKILIDLSEIKYVDSSGLGALLLGLRQSRDNEGQFALCGAQNRVLNLIQIAQLNGVLKNYSDELQALDDLK
jgi:anti-sigma B factor antagonist